VENSGRCNTNAEGEKILPNGMVWLPAVVEQIVQVATGATTSIFVDKKLIDGPNANERGKWWIPLVIVAQYLLVVRPIKQAIEKDLVEEKNQRPQWEIRAEEFRRNTSLFEDDQADEQAISQAFQQDVLGDQLGSFDDDDDDEDDY